MGEYRYKDSGVEWLGRIPEHWKIVRIKSLAQIITGNTPPKLDSENYNGGNIPWVKPDALNGQIVSSTAEFLTAKGAAYARIIPESSILIGCIGELGRFAISGLALTTNQQINSLVPDNSRLSSNYAKYLVQIIKPALESNATVVVVAILNKTRLGNISVAIPSLAEQHQIHTHLDKVCVKVDEAIQLKQSQLIQLETIEKSIANKATLNGLNPKAKQQKIEGIWFDELPEHWELRRLKDVSDMQTGITLGKEFQEETEERPYLRVGNVQDGYLALDKMKTIRLPPRLIPRYELRAGDVLMTEGGDLDKLGRGYVWQAQIEGCLHQNHVFALRCYPHKLLPDYLALLTSSTHGRAYFEIMGKKTTNLASINSTKVNLFPVPLPPIEEQQQIVDWVQEKRDKIQQTRKAVSDQIQVLTQYRKSLIHECVTGKKQVYHSQTAS